MTPQGLFEILSSASCGVFALATDQTVVFWNGRAREILGYTPALIVGRRCSGIVNESGKGALTSVCEEGCPMLRSLHAGLVPGRARIRMRCSWGEWKWLEVTPMVVSGVEDGGPLLVYLFGDSDEPAVSADVQSLVELGGGAGLRLNGGQYYARPRDFLDHPPGEGGEAEPDPDHAVMRSSGPQWDDEGDSADDSRPLRPNPELGPSEVHLTERERQALSYLALGWETKYIAEEMGVSWYTARNHIENLRTKLGATTRLEAVMVAMRLGIIPSD